VQSALVLNATYEPLSVVPVRRAVCLVLSEKAEILHDDGTEVRSARHCVARPLVVRLRYVVKVPYHRRTALSRRAVFARDNHRCQYCGGHADSIDHVMPRSRGGEHIWENVAAACRPCNLRKRDRTPDEAGMRLARYPATPRELAWVVVAVGRVPDSWKPYLAHQTFTRAS
jgi:5-methylcytosine-specific restriction endonuclease McrA